MKSKRTASEENARRPNSGAVAAALIATVRGVRDNMANSTLPLVALRGKAKKTRCY